MNEQEEWQWFWFSAIAVWFDQETPDGRLIRSGAIADPKERLPLPVGYVGRDPMFPPPLVGRIVGASVTEEALVVIGKAALPLHLYEKALQGEMSMAIELIGGNWGTHHTEDGTVFALNSGASLGWATIAFWPGVWHNQLMVVGTANPIPGFIPPPIEP